MQHILIEHAGIPGLGRGEAFVGSGRAVSVPPSRVCRAMATPNIVKKILYDTLQPKKALASQELEVEWEWGFPLKEGKRKN